MIHKHDYYHGFDLHKKNLTNIQRFSIAIFNRYVHSKLSYSTGQVNS